MARTKAQIGIQALEELGVLPLGQTPTADQSDKIKTAYDQVWEALDRRNIAVWGKTEDIPDAYVNPVVALVAAQRLNVFGVSNDRYARVAGAARGAEDEIRRLNAGDWMNTSGVEDF